MTESKVAFAAEEQLVGSLRQQRGTVEQRLREQAQLIAQRRGEMGAFISRKQQAESDIQESRGEIDRLAHLRSQVNEQAAQLLAQKQAQESDISGREENLREQRRSLGSITEQQRFVRAVIAPRLSITKTEVIDDQPA